MTDLSRTAERVVLGAAMLSAEVADELAGIVVAESFELPQHRSIWSAIRSIRGRREPAEPLRVAERLDGNLAKVGGAPYLLECTEAVPVIQSAPHYARKVADAAEQRRLRMLAEVLRDVAEADADTRPVRLAEFRETLAVGTPGATAGEPDSWAPLDLGPHLRGEVRRPEPSIGVVRTDGLRFIYPGKEHSVIGEMESGKSWFMLACAAAELVEDRHVLYVHFEEADPSDTVERLQALGVPDDRIEKLFRFVAPAAPITPERLAILLVPPPTLVLLDGVNEAMALHGQGVREEDGAAAFRRRLVMPFIRAGAATLSGDHVVKNQESRGRYALGSIHKGNALSGALILLENAEPFGRGQKGCSHVFVTKDRPGHLRRHGRGTKVSGKTYMGALVVDDTRRWVPYLDLTILAPGPEEERAPTRDPAEELADAVYEVIAACPDGTVLSKRELLARLRKADVQARDQAVVAACDDLLVAGRLAPVRGKRGAEGYRATGKTSSPTASHDPNEVEP